MLLTSVICFWFISTANSQTLQKFSIGVQGGLTTPLEVKVSGDPLAEFKPQRTTDFSRGLIMQYDLSPQFYVRSSFKKANAGLKNKLQTKTSDTTSFEGDYNANFTNKQLELSFGYRQKLSRRWQLTSSLGATYLNLKSYGDRDLKLMFPVPGDPYAVYQAPIVEKEKSVLLNAALGLEYKTRRDNVFSLELGYYKGFETVANYKFMVIDNFSHESVVPVKHSSLNWKGDYAEVRLGYRMPIQKFTNLYKAINNPKPKLIPEPDTVRQERYTGKYWGLELGRQTYYAKQVQEMPTYTDRVQIPVAWTAYLTFYKGYKFKSGLSLEGGIRVGTVNIQAVSNFGLISGWSNWLLTTPVSVKYSIPVLRNRIYLTPEAGFWQSYSNGIGKGDSYWSDDLRFGDVHNIVTHSKGYGHDYFVGYHAGLSLNSKVGKTIEIGVGYRFADRFSQKPLMMEEINYDRNNVPQPAFVSKSNLKNDAITLSFRKFLRK